MRCADCKYFELEAVPYGPSRGFGHCSRWHEGYCVSVNDVARNEVLVEDDEGWGNMVGPDFGCVLFEAS